MDSSALGAAAVFELEGEVVSVNVNSLFASLHSTVIAITEVVETEFASAEFISMFAYQIIEIIFSLVIVVAVVIPLLIDLCGIISLRRIIFILRHHLKQRQAIDHAAIVIKCILLAFDCLEFAGIQMTASICVVPGIFIIIVLLFIQKFGTDNLEPALAYAGAVVNIVEVLPCLAVLGT
mgnify:CR=1 FL=1